MKHYQLTITSKNKKSLNNFLIFLSINLKTNFNIIKKYSQKRKKKVVLTILKSPHVNKTAQEQFEIKFFSKQLSLYSPQNFKLLLFLKKVKINLFPDINLELKFVINKNLSEKKKTDTLNLRNFRLNCFKTSISQKNKLKSTFYCKKYSANTNKSLKKISHFIKIMDLYGSYTKF
jgi:ribosomal protein S10